MLLPWIRLGRKTKTLKPRGEPARIRARVFNKDQIKKCLKNSGFCFLSIPVVFNNIQHPPRWRRVERKVLHAPNSWAGWRPPYRGVTEVLLCKKNSSRFDQLQICAMVLSSWNDFHGFFFSFTWLPFTLLCEQVLFCFDLVFMKYCPFLWLWLTSLNKLNCH